MGKLIVKIIGVFAIVFILVFISDAIFHWAGPEGPAYCFGNILGRISRSIINLL